MSVLTSLLLPITTVLAEESYSINYNDPYHYDKDELEGTQLPKDGTNQYNNRYSKDTVGNFNFDTEDRLDTVTGASYHKTTQLLNNSPSFEGGYHEYHDAAKNASVFTKKIVKPTTNPNVFDIQLDVISGQKTEKEKIDIAFVFDKSGSMNNSAINGKSPNSWSYKSPSRWEVLNDSFSSFLDQYIPSNELGTYDVEFAMSSFYSQKIKSWERPTVDYAVYENRNLYSKDKYAIRNHPILKIKPSGGTPTFLGEVVGTDLISNPNYRNTERNGAKKVLIYITDGQPTFDGTSNFKGTNSLTYQGIDYYQNPYWGSKETGFGYVEKYYLGDNKLYDGNGTSSEFNYILNNRPSVPPNTPKIMKYAIGIGNEVSKFGPVLNAIGPDSPEGGYQITTNIETQLSKVFKEIEQDINNSVSSISNGTIIDEMSEFVTLKEDSIRNYDLTLKNGKLNQVGERTKDNLSISENMIQVNNLSLDGTQDSSMGYRLTYQVELKNEFRNNHFYPANKPTYLFDMNNPQGIGFAVPSIKSNLRNISVEKEWIGNEAVKPTINLHLKADGTIVDTAVLKNGETKYTFKNQPVVSQTGKTINYEIEEEISYLTNSPEITYQSEVTGDSDRGFKITNRPIADFSATKTASTKELKPNETFSYEIQVKNTVNGSLLENLQVTDTMPEGIEIISQPKLNDIPTGEYNKESFNLVIPKLEGDQIATIQVDVQVKSEASEGKKINKAVILDPKEPDKPKEPTAEVEVIRQSNILLRKIDFETNTKVLSGAEFELYKKDTNGETLVAKYKTDDSGVVRIPAIKTGKYLIKEIKAPENYDLLTKPIVLDLTSTGKLSLQDSLSGYVELKQVDQMNEFQITVKNKEVQPDPGILPETGGFGNGKTVLVASLLIGSSILLMLIFFLNQRRRWR